MRLTSIGLVLIGAGAVRDIGIAPQLKADVRIGIATQHLAVFDNHVVVGIKCISRPPFVGRDLRDIGLNGGRGACEFFVRAPAKLPMS